MIILPILPTSFIHFSLKGPEEGTFWTWEWKGWIGKMAWCRNECSPSVQPQVKAILLLIMVIFELQSHLTTSCFLVISLQGVVLHKPKSFISLLYTVVLPALKVSSTFYRLILWQWTINLQQSTQPRHLPKTNFHHGLVSQVATRQQLLCCAQVWSLLIIKQLQPMDQCIKVQITVQVNLLVKIQNFWKHFQISSAGMKWFLSLKMFHFPWKQAMHMSVEVLYYTYVYPCHMLTNTNYPNVIHSTVALHCRV